MSETCDRHGEPICSINPSGRGECFECLTERVASKIATHDTKTIARWIVHNAISPYEAWPYSPTAEILPLDDATDPLFENPDCPILNQMTKRHEELSRQESQTGRDFSTELSFNGALEGFE